MAPKKMIAVTRETPAPAEAPAPPPAPAPAVVDDEPVAVVVEATAVAPAEEDPIQAKLAKLTEFVTARAAAAKEELQRCKEMSALIKALTKEVAQVQKKSHGRRQGKKPKQEGDAQKQSGFNKPVALSDALCDFLGIPHGEMLARTKVTHRITTYINENKLFDESDKRNILPDEKLATLLGIKDADPAVKLSYFNLQTYMRQHYLKDADASPSASESEATTSS
jgi:chromatin remodeling complex protein RSC6